MRELSDLECQWLTEILARDALRVTAVADVRVHVGPVQVWRIDAAASSDEPRRYYLKHYPEARKLIQEEHAYRAWCTVIAHATPRLLAVDRSLALLLTTGLQGRPVAEGVASRTERIAIHRQAGSVLSRLHRQPYDDADPMPLADAIVVRADRWLTRARDTRAVDARTLERTRALVRDGASFDGERRVPCHRDFTPRNWIYDTRRQKLGIIDFEHSRADHFLVDFIGTVIGGDGPEVRAAFADGYGFELDDDDRARLRVLTAIWALGTIVWSVQSSDATFLAQGRDALARALGDGSSPDRRR